MNDLEFIALKEEISLLTRRLNILQDVYRLETGRNFIPASHGWMDDDNAYARRFGEPPEKTKCRENILNVRIIRQ